MSPESESWRTSRQLGSLMGEEEDVRRRMELASRVFGQLYALWLRRDKVAEKTRLRLYNAIVLPTFLYNCETWGLSSTAMAKADAFHRRQMRSLLGIRYPDTISNDDLYRRTKSNPISDTVACRFAVIETFNQLNNTFSGCGNDSCLHDCITKPTG